MVEHILEILKVSRNNGLTKEEVFKRFCAKAQLNYNDVKFYYNSTEFNVWGKTLEQLNLANFFTFEVVNDKTLRGA